MPLLFGPKNSRYTYTGTPCPHNDLALKSDAKTLGDAIQHYETYFNVRVRPCLEPLPGQREVKYFVVTDVRSEVIWYVDIHVFRHKEEICPKQNVTFRLEVDDLVEMGELVC